MIYREFKDRSLITDNFKYSDSKGLMSHLIGCFNSDDELIGFISYNIIQGDIQILFIEVLKAYRRNGIARNLIKELTKRHLKNYSAVEVFAETEEGRDLFRSCVDQDILPSNTVIGGFD